MNATSDVLLNDPYSERIGNICHFFQVDSRVDTPCFAHDLHWENPKCLPLPKNMD